MGLVYSTITLSNPTNANLKPVETKCLVDTGSTYLCIPGHMANQLGLKVLEEREVTLASGEARMVDYVGPIKVSFDNRNCFVGALIIGEEVLLGAIPMEDMDLIVHPKLLKLAVNPESPNFARGSLK